MVRLFKEDSYDDMLNPKLFMIPDVWEDEVYDVVEKAKSLGIKEEAINYDNDSETIKIIYSPYDRIGYERCAKLYNWFVHYMETRDEEFTESVSLKEREYVDDKYVLTSKESMNMEDDLKGIYVDDSLDILEDELSAEGFEYYDEGQCLEPKDCGYRIWVNGTFKVTIYYGLDDNIVFNIYVKEKDNMMEGVEIEVKHEGILEVPEGKKVDQLPMSHFEKLAKKKGLGKITKALNNLQVWNKNDDPELSKWAGNMIDKLNKKLKKDESVSKRFVENGRRPKYGYTIADYVEIRKDAISKGYTGNEPLRDFMREYDLTDTEAIAILSQIRNGRNAKESVSRKIAVKESPMDYLDTTTRSIIDKMEQLGYTGSRKPIMFDGKPMGYWSKTYFTDKRTSSGIQVYIDPFDGSVEVQEFEYDVDTEDLTDICPVKNVVSSNDVIKIDRWAKAAKKHSYSLNYESLGYDRYDPNVEADFMGHDDLYNDMPDEEPTQDDVFEFYVSYCMNNCRNENEARKYLEYENLPESFIDSIIEEVYNRFDEQL